MTRLLRLRRLAILPILVLGLATMLGGCVAYPYGYDYGRGYGWYSGRRPIVVVQRPAGDTEDEHGQVVKGRGYVSGRNGSAGSGSASGRSGGSSGGSSGSAGRASTDSEKGSSTGRKAKPRPGK